MRPIFRKIAIAAGLLVLAIFCMTAAALNSGLRSHDAREIGRQPSPDIIDSDLRAVWDTRLQDVGLILTGALPYGEEPGRRHPIDIRAAADITGDGVPEALIMSGAGGANSTYLPLVMIDQDKLTIARLRASDGTVFSGATLLESLSATRMSGVHLDALHKAVLVGRIEFTDVSNASPTCQLDAYVWNVTTRIFEWNGVLGSDLRPTYCTGWTDTLQPH